MIDRWIWLLILVAIRVLEDGLSCPSKLPHRPCVGGRMSYRYSIYRGIRVAISHNTPDTGSVGEFCLAHQERLSHELVGVEDRRWECGEEAALE